MVLLQLFISKDGLIFKLKRAVHVHKVSGWLAHMCCLRPLLKIWNLNKSLAPVLWCFKCCPCLLCFLAKFCKAHFCIVPSYKNRSPFLQPRRNTCYSVVKLVTPLLAPLSQLWPLWMCKLLETWNPNKIFPPAKLLYRLIWKRCSNNVLFWLDTLGSHSHSCSY